MRGLLKDRLLRFEVIAVGITILLRYGLPIYGFDVTGFGPSRSF